MTGKKANRWVPKDRKIMYVSLAPDVDEYIRTMAAKSGMSLARVCDAIFRDALERDLEIFYAVTAKEGDGNDGA
jgi:hypothetical protein